MHENIKSEKMVLVGVIKNRRDLNILLSKRWYRIPAERLPKNKFQYIAFYQPGSFGKNGKRIEYYARVAGAGKHRRSRLLPEERNHPRAKVKYIKFDFKRINRLKKPVRNIVPRRISFGFTTLKKLVSAKNILELYGVPPIERIIEKELNRLGAKTYREYPVSKNGRRCRIDIALFDRNRKIAIECDNKKAHGSKAQLRKDWLRDNFLRKLGWKVVRLREADILEDPGKCVEAIRWPIKPKDSLSKQQLKCPA